MVRKVILFELFTQLVQDQTGEIHNHKKSLHTQTLLAIVDKQDLLRSMSMIKI